MEYIKNNFLSFVVIVLIAILFLQRCGGGEHASIQAPIIIKDTVWVVKDSVVYSKPQLVKTIQSDSIIREYYRLPDTTPYHTLLSSYNRLVESYLQTNIQVDSLKIDSLGYVQVRDSVSRNLVLGRSYNYNLKYPYIKETIYIPAKRRNQVYIGGGISGTLRAKINQIDAGLLFKNKKDQIFGVRVGINTLGEVSYGLQSYWKIKL